jgi:hypothetical protein
MSNERPRVFRNAELSPDLMDDKSLLVRTIRIANDAWEAEIPQAVGLIADAQVLAKQSCPHYRSDIGDPTKLLCHSGADGKKPFQGKACTIGCRLSQVSWKHGEYVYAGCSQLVTIEDQLMNQIFPDREPESPAPGKQD